MLYSFQGGGLPYGALIFDKQGNLYGTLQGGGDPNYNPGSIFELSPAIVPGSAWTESLLWTFPLDGREGFQPFGKLVMDDDGNLYGTTQLGGGNQCGCGVVFELVSPKESGGLWAERILHNFGAVAHDGVSPGPDLLLQGGVLYGTTQGSGGSGSGTFFQLVRKPGQWTETILYTFTRGVSGVPYGGMVADSGGSFYGAAHDGGSAPCGCGTIYKLSPPVGAGDPWQETTLYTFTGGSDGASPVAALWRDKLGDLYGTTLGGNHSAGTVFKLVPPAGLGEAWTLVVLHSFGSPAGAATGSSSALTMLEGVLYGTTSTGGVGSDLGRVFSVVP